LQLGQEQIAMRVGVHKSVVSRALALLEQPKEIRQMVADERLSPTHLRSLDEIPDHCKRTEVLLNQVAVCSTERKRGCCFVE